jgi:hypothetical protein
LTVSFSPKAKVAPTMQPEKLTLARPSADVPDPLRQKILGMTRRRNWSEGAKAIHDRDCNAALDFVRSALAIGIPAPTFVAPSANGAVSFSWKKGRNLIGVEVSAKSPNMIHFWWGGPTEGSKEGSVQATAFLKRLAAFIGPKLASK